MFDSTFVIQSYLLLSVILTIISPQATAFFYYSFICAGKCNSAFTMRLDFQVFDCKYRLKIRDFVDFWYQLVTSYDQAIIFRYTAHALESLTVQEVTPPVVPSGSLFPSEVYFLVIVQFLVSLF